LTAKLKLRDTIMQSDLPAWVKEAVRSRLN
jgi:hypothetical protein